VLVVVALVVVLLVVVELTDEVLLVDVLVLELVDVGATTRSKDRKSVISRCFTHNSMSCVLL
jgi:hypothetical protein